MLTLDQAIKFLKSEKVVAFPTETVYGLGAPLFSEEAVRAVYAVKKRPSDNPLIAHISDFYQAQALAGDLPELFYVLAEKFWPGPLTLVIPKAASVPSLPCAGLDTIAIRMPCHPLALKLIRGVGEPLVAPSANLSGRPSPTRASHVLQDLGDEIAGVLDGGPCAKGIESTVIGLFPDPVLLRPGSISLEQLSAICSVKKAPEPSKASPGTRHRHYAPKTRLKLFTSKDKIPSNLTLLSTESLARPHRLITAQNFYASLRQIDTESHEEVGVLCTTRDSGLEDRIIRATTN